MEIVFIREKVDVSKEVLTAAAHFSNARTRLLRFSIRLYKRSFTCWMSRKTGEKRIEQGNQLSSRIITVYRAKFKIPRGTLEFIHLPRRTRYTLIRNLVKG